MTTTMMTAVTMKRILETVTLDGMSHGARVTRDAGAAGYGCKIFVYFIYLEHCIFETFTVLYPRQSSGLLTV